MKVPFLDLSGQHKEIKKDLDASFRELAKRSDYILGKDVGLFEKDFAAYCGKRFAVGVNSGTDALFLALKSLGIGPGDEVIVPAFTYIATSLAVDFCGAKPVFADINEKTNNIDSGKIAEKITNKTKAVIPVHLYGHPADMQPILEIAAKNGLKVIEDSAQAHGAKYRFKNGDWRMAGGIGDIGCFSFYPTKNLGAFGDGGIVVTDEESVYKKLLMLRDYGRKSRYEHVALGYNSRLDTMQAAVLRAKLPRLDKWNEMRRANAALYNKFLKGAGGVIIPDEAEGVKHVYHVYGVRVKNRDAVVKEMSENGVGVLIHYPIPLHLQEVYRHLGFRRGDFPAAEKVAAEIFSMPMYPYLKKEQIKFAAETLRKITG